MRLLFASMLIVLASPCLAGPAANEDGPRIEVIRVADGHPIDVPTESPANTEATRLLQTPVEIGAERMVFEDAVQALRDQTGLKITVNWSASEIPGIDQDTPVELDLDGQPAEQVLRMMLEFVSANAFEDDKLGYCLRDGVVYISMIAELKELTECRIYNLTPLMVEPFRPVGLIYEEDAFNDTIAFHSWRRGQRAYPFTDPMRLTIYKQHAQQMQDEIDALVLEHGSPEQRDQGQQARPVEGADAAGGGGPGGDGGGGAADTGGGLFFADDSSDPEFVMSYEERIDQLWETIQDNVGDQDEWLDEDSTIDEVGGRFIITTTRANHHAIESLLNGLLHQEVEDQADIMRDAQVMQMLHRASEIQLEGDFEGALLVTERALLIDPDHITANAMRRVLSEIVERMRARDGAGE